MKKSEALGMCCAFINGQFCYLVFSLVNVCLSFDLPISLMDYYIVRQIDLFCVERIKKEHLIIRKSILDLWLAVFLIRHLFLFLFFKELIRILVLYAL